MSPRKAVYAMFAAGLVVILVLTLIPYTLLTSARQVVNPFVAPPDEALREIETRTPPAPLIEVASWYAERDESPELHGVLVESADGRATLADHNADKPFNPASLIKLATTLVALRRLRADYRFETRVYTEGQTDERGVLTGKVIIAGLDPTFGDYAAGLRTRLASRDQTLHGEIMFTPGFRSLQRKARGVSRVAARCELKEKGRCG